MPSFADELRKMRRYRGLTQSEIAEGICTRQYIVRIESGQAVPKARVLLSLCTRLECPLVSVVNAYLEVQSDPLELPELAVMLSEQGALRDGFALVNRLVRPLVSRDQLLYLWGQMLDAAGHAVAALPLYRSTMRSLPESELIEGLFRFAKCERKAGEVVEAHRLYSEILVRVNASRIIDQSLKGRILVNLANVEFALGFFSSASGHYAETLAVAQRCKNTELQISSLIGASACSLSQHHFSEALEMLEECEMLCKAVGQTDLLPQVYNNLGIAKSHLGQVDEAVRLLGKSIALKRASGLTASVIYGLNELTRIHLDAGRLDDACVVSSEALSILSPTTDRRETVLALELAARLLMRNEEVSQALILVERGLNLLGDTPSAERGKLLCLAAEAGFRLGQCERATACCREAFEMFCDLEKEGDPR